MKPNKEKHVYENISFDWIDNWKAWLITEHASTYMSERGTVRGYPGVELSYVPGNIVNGTELSILQNIVEGMKGLEVVSEEG